jgi:hypothetical protein
MPIVFQNGIIIKTSRKKCFITNLTRAETNTLEKDCLTSLNRNFECICKHKKNNHFPEFIKIDNNERIHMTYCGVNIKTMSRENWGISEIQKYKESYINIDDAEEQVNCIIYNLKKNGILNLDNHLHGNNLCILGNTIYMIDFGNAITPNNIKCKFILERDWGNLDIYYNFAKTDLIYILKSHEAPGKYNSNIMSFDNQYDYTAFNYTKYIKLRNKNIKCNKT